MAELTGTLSLGFALQGASPSGLLSVSPPVLFFFLGVVAALVRSNLRIPGAITKVLSLYLLWAIGFRGGVELVAAGLTPDTAKVMALALALSLITPVGVYLVLRRTVGISNAAALAGCYGSVSVVTFLTACAALEQSATPYGGHMIAAMALMEAPALVVAMILFHRDEPRADAIRMPGVPGGGRGSKPDPAHSWTTLMHEALLNGPVLLLLGSLAIGVLTGQRGYAAFKPLCTDMFPGALAFFLLDMGLVSARRMRQLIGVSRALPVFAIVAPLIHAALAIVASKVLGIAAGDAILLAVLAASASYIAAPAALRLAIPKAEPAMYVSLALGVTFPFNIIVGIPFYTAVVSWWW